MCFGLVVLHHRRFLGHQLQGVHHYLSHVYDVSPWIVLALAFLVINLIVILNLGFHTTIAVLFCIIIRNFYFSFLITFVSFMCADLVMFFLAEALVCSCLVARVRRSSVFRVVSEQSKRTPFKIAFVTRFLLLGPGVKNLILFLIELRAAPYFISSAVYNIFFCGFAYLISADVNQITELDSKHMKWSEMEVGQRLVLAASMATMVFSLVVVVLLVVWVRRKLKAQERGEGRESGQEVRQEDLRRSSETEGVVRIEGISSLGN